MYKRKGKLVSQEIRLGPSTIEQDGIKGNSHGIKGNFIPLDGGYHRIKQHSFNTEIIL